MSSTLQRPAIRTRYTLTAQALHWLTALLFLAVLPLGWIALSLPQREERNWIFVLHRLIGVTILAAVVARLVWRATLLAMPISGYLQSGNGRPVSYFGLFDLPGLPQNATLDAAGEWVHLTGQWLVYALVSLHLLATAWHVAIKRDGLLNRMIPPQDDAAQR
ncbi:MAG: cytochrome b [Gemmatimonadaceae bacterium]|nr:cytochrome b [Acetobacteraceae bacterium]